MTAGASADETWGRTRGCVGNNKQSATLAPAMHASTTLPPPVTVTCTPLATTTVHSVILLPAGGRMACLCTSPRPIVANAQQHPGDSSSAAPENKGSGGTEQGGGQWGPNTQQNATHKSPSASPVTPANPSPALPSLSPSQPYLVLRDTLCSSGAYGVRPKNTGKKETRA